MSEANGNANYDATSASQVKYCRKCDRTDVEEGMVCCDRCDSWQHFRCAGVNDSIADPDRSWKCSECRSSRDSKTRSHLSFNESSVSESSRVSQKLQLSLQLLEDQRALKKKRAEEELRIRKLEEEVKLKEIDEEQEYLKQRYELLMQIEEEKESASRKSRISMRSRRERIEEWITKESQGDEIGQSKPSTSGHKATPSVAAASQAYSGTFLLPTTKASSIAGTLANPSTFSHGRLYADPKTAVSGDNVTALTKSYMPCSVPTIPGSSSCSIPFAAISTIPVTVVTTAGGNLVPPPMNLRWSVTGTQNYLASCAAPVYSYSGINTVSSAAGRIPSVPTSTCRVYGNSSQYLAQASEFSHAAPVVTGNIPIVSTSSLQFPTFSVAAPYNCSPLVSVPTTTSFPTLPTMVNGYSGNPAALSYPGASAPSDLRPEAISSVLPTALGFDNARGNFSVSVAGPTGAQAAARQVMPHALPEFNGDPEEWPLFYCCFKKSTEVCGYTEDENMCRLRKCLRGEALETVGSRLWAGSVASVMERLYMFYGKPEILINSLLEKVDATSPPKKNDFNSIVTFGLVIQNLVDHIVLTNHLAHLSNPTLLGKLVKKLPHGMQMQWGEFKLPFADVNLATFNAFMMGQVNLAAGLRIDVGTVPKNTKQQFKKDKTVRTEKLFTHASESNSTSEEEEAGREPPSRACHHCEKGGHRIINCFSFKSLNIGDRWKAMRQKNLCPLCLIPHRREPCRSNNECGVDGCRVRHHMLLHSSRKDEV